MRRGAFIGLALLIPSACREAPEPSAQSAAQMTASAAPLTLIAPDMPSAAPPSPAPTAQPLAGFPVCPARTPFDPKNPKTIPRSTGDMIFAADELGPQFRACLKRSVPAPAKINMQIGVQPNGRICGVSLSSTVPLSAACFACFAQSLHSYRFSAAGSTEEFIMPVRFFPDVP